MNDRYATLDRLFEGFNQHDADAVMACFASDAVFFTAAGPTAAGRKIEGLDAIRAAFVASDRDARRALDSALLARLR